VQTNDLGLTRIKQFHCDPDQDSKQLILHGDQQHVIWNVTQPVKCHLWMRIFNNPHTTGGAFL
jgi:hypothetical protein